MTSNHQDQERGMALGASEGTNPADTLILDFQPPEERGINVCCLSTPPALPHSVVSISGSSHRLT